ncbi:MAG TPA: hypothetical protein VFO46_17065 [Candidatus Sulfotelmatobacter sp.]|nr:hypothetical protein [Candidatus Sulfotelmatobacter sp.]
MVFRVNTLVLAASLLFASLSSAQTSDGRPPANELVRQIIDNELQAEKNDRSHWMLRLETRKSGTTEVREVVETRDGDLDWLISVNGKPLPADQRSERQRGLQRLINNPAALKKSKQETNEDQARSQRLLKILPDALVYEYGEQRGDLVELKFKPNLHFRPSSHEAAVVHAMQGVLWVKGSQKRLVEISGRLTRPVKFGGGLLGHLDAGGQFYVKQEEVQPGYWELTVLDVDMKGKALFFKTIGVQEEMKRSMFRRVRDDLTAAQGANLLYQQVRTTSKISFNTETAISSHCRMLILKTLARARQRRAKGSLSQSSGSLVRARAEVGF